eukprot:TRINITY_DN540_c0_g1_i28.p1 TRINITY_DN540_c0_g1~~TRINITY_DN540_c0_g1_i28.p1  ORF type:complete len:148 (-),score=36.33 TRINITY_DN540_c0_g1_i28:69-512(-)
MCIRDRYQRRVRGPGFASPSRLQMSLPAISHRSRVMRVYKSLLVTQRNWAIDRDVFNTEALKTQALFRSRASETNPTIIAAYVEEAERKLAHFRHPDPYIPVSYTHLRAHETPEHLVCRLLLEKKKKKVRDYESQTKKKIKIQKKKT